MNWEAAESYAYGAVGAAAGVYRYAIRPEITARRSWLAIGVFVAAHELLCGPGELLSEGVDRAIEQHPVLVTAFIGYTALHLMNVLPESLDIYHRLVKRSNL